MLAQSNSSRAYSQLLDVLGVIQSGVRSKAMSIDDALKDGQARAEAAMVG